MPLVVDLDWSVISLEEFQKLNQGLVFTKAELRKKLQGYLEPRLVMYHRTPGDGHFDTEWKHTSSLLVAKTVKDMLI